MLLASATPLSPPKYLHRISYKPEGSRDEWRFIGVVAAVGLSVRLNKNSSYNYCPLSSIRDHAHSPDQTFPAQCSIADWNVKLINSIDKRQKEIRRALRRGRKIEARLTDSKTDSGTVSVATIKYS